MPRATCTTPRRWPFWLLIAAWVCANSPQAATYAVLEWVASARHFSHQQQLSREVAHLLAGEKAPPRSRTIVATTEEPEAPRAFPPVPIGAVLKKIDLSSERGSELPDPSRVGVHHPRPSDWRGEIRRAPPPHGPPRFAPVA